MSYGSLYEFWMFQFTAIALGAWSSTFVHELGHALAFWACRVRVRSIETGVGPSFTLRICGVRWVFGLNPLAGFCKPGAVRKNAKWDYKRSIFVSAAGPVLEGLVGLLIIVGGAMFCSIETNLLLWSGAMFYILGAIVNLIPMGENDGASIRDNLRELMQTKQSKEVAV